MSKIKTLAGETVLYGLGNIIPKALAFFLVTLHTSVFLPAAYGRFTMISAAVTFINIIFTFGMETAFFRFATKTEANPSLIFSQVQSIIFSICIPLTIVFIAFANPIASAFHVGDQPSMIVWVSLVMMVDAVVAIPFARLRLQKKPLKYALAKIINIVVYIGLSYYFLKLNFDPAVGIGYIFLANLIANATYLLFFAKDFLQWRPEWNRSLVSDLVRYAWPVMLGGLAWAINEMFSRTMLERWLPGDFYGLHSKEAALGIFGACYKFSALMNLAIQAFRYAAEPFFFSNAADKNSPALFARVNHYFVIVCCFLLLGVSINMDVLKYFLDNAEYWSGISIIPVLLLAYLFLGLYYNFSVWYKLSDKTYFGTLIFGGGALLTVILNYLLIPRFGYMGSSWATLIVYFAMAGVCYLLGQKYYPIPYSILSGTAYISATMIIIYTTSQFAFGSLWISVPVHGAIMISCLAIVWLIEKPSLPARA